MLKFIRSTAVRIIFLVFFIIGIALCIKFPHKVITAKNIVVSYWYVYKGDKHYRHKELIEAINDYRKALEYYKKALTVYKMKLGEAHPYTQDTQLSVQIMKLLIELGIDEEQLMKLIKRKS